MRTKSVLINGFYSIISYILILILGLIIRRIFLMYFGAEYLGYEGLFSNIFSILSVAELGIGSAIIYNLYHEIALQNNEEVAKWMNIYRYLYKIIGILILCISLSLIPFLKIIITKNITNWDFIYYIYIIQLVGILFTYFLAYKRILFIANQMDFVCVKIDTIVTIVSHIIRLFIIIVTKNYLLYLSISIFQNLASNLIIAFKYNKHFSLIKDVNTSITLKDIKSKNLFVDIKNLLIHKISLIVYGGVDNIVISYILGINIVGIYSNYLIISNSVNGILRRLTDPLSASIGNLVYSKEKNHEDGLRLFYSFDLFFFFIASFVFTSLIVLFQPFIELWLGNEYLLPTSMVFYLSVNSYIIWIHTGVLYYRQAFGDYQIDRIWMMMAAISNLGLSIILSIYFGISGILIGTLIGHVFIWFGRVNVVFKLYLKSAINKYIRIQIQFAILAIIEVSITYYVSKYISTTLWGMLLRGLLCLLVPNVINYFVFYKDERFLVIRNYVSLSVSLIKKFLENKKSSNVI